MPLYEYQCTECKRIVEVLHDKVNEPAPKCHGEMVKLMSCSSFQLKGTGWYKTDYQNKGKKDKKEE